MSLFFPRTCRVAACSLSSSSSTVLAAAAGVASGSSFSSATTFRSSAARGFAVQAKVDHYAVLGVPRRATKKEIKEKFYELSKRYHPDLAPGDAAKQKYLSISQAYDTLGNDNKRSAYDQTLSPTGFSSGVTRSSQSPYATRSGRPSAWVHPSTRLPPRAPGARRQSPAPEWTGQRQSNTHYYQHGQSPPPNRPNAAAAGAFQSPFSPYHSPDHPDSPSPDQFSRPLQRRGGGRLENEHQAGRFKMGDGNNPYVIGDDRPANTWAMIAFGVGAVYFGWSYARDSWYGPSGKDF